jgi:hypothetical protein
MDETDRVTAALIARNRALLARAEAAQARAIEVRLTAEHLRQMVAATAARRHGVAGGAAPLNPRATS